LKRLGCLAACCPVGPDQNDGVVDAYAAPAQNADIIIAEVGAWSNALTAKDSTRRQALKQCRRRLDLADRIGARFASTSAWRPNTSAPSPKPSRFPQAILSAELSAQSGAISVATNTKMGSQVLVPQIILVILRISVTFWSLSCL